MKSTSQTFKDRNNPWYKYTESIIRDWSRLQGDVIENQFGCCSFSFLTSLKEKALRIQFYSGQLQQRHTHTHTAALWPQMLMPPLREPQDSCRLDLYIVGQTIDSTSWPPSSFTSSLTHSSCYSHTHTRAIQQHTFMQTKNHMHHTYMQPACFYSCVVCAHVCVFMWSPPGGVLYMCPSCRPLNDGAASNICPLFSPSIDWLFCQ